MPRKKNTQQRFWRGAGFVALWIISGLWVMGWAAAEHSFMCRAAGF